MNKYLLLFFTITNALLGINVKDWANGEYTGISVCLDVEKEDDTAYDNFDPYKYNSGHWCWCKLKTNNNCWVFNKTPDWSEPTCEQNCADDCEYSMKNEIKISNSLLQNCSSCSKDYPNYDKYGCYANNYKIACNENNGSGYKICSKYYPSSTENNVCGSCVYTSCNNGYYLNNNLCSSCPSDSYCNNNTKYKCPNYRKYFNTIVTGTSVNKKFDILDCIAQKKYFENNIGSGYYQTCKYVN